MMKNIIFSLAFILASFAAYAQIGYQVTLLDRATGEPRSGETVVVSVEITNSAGAVIYSGTQSATTNDFGILSLSVGNSTTFDNVDWSKLPLSISATVDGILIGRSQILNVPVAEYAKRSGVLTSELLSSRNWNNGYDYISFSQSGSFSWGSFSGSYIIDGNTVFLISDERIKRLCVYVPSLDKLFFSDL